MDIQSHFPTPVHVQTEGRAERVLFGYRIPSLPSFTGDNNPSNLIVYQEMVLRKHLQVVGTLANKPYTAHSLRYVFDPKTRHIEVIWLGRVLTPLGHGATAGRHLASEIKSTLNGLEFVVEPLKNIEELQTYLQPLAQYRISIFEICQAEHIINLALMPAYVVLPFSSPTGNWQNLFSYLVEQTAPWFINVYLEPTVTSQIEQKGFGEANFFAQNMTQFGRQNQFSDANAGWLGGYYRLYQNRTAKPQFLQIIQLGSPDERLAYSLANTFGAELTSQKIAAPVGFSETAQLEAGFDVVLARSSQDWTAFTRTLCQLDFYATRSSKYAAQSEYQPLAYQERLRYLVDTDAAVSAFRWPIAGVRGIPGVQTKQIVPSYDVGARHSTGNPGELYLGEYSDRGGAVSLAKSLLRAQTLIAGTTGSGKTTTCFQLVGELWSENIPFLVIEPAKAVYRQLLNTTLGPDLQIYTLGDETVSPFRFNPFEILPGVRVEAHITTIKTCLESSMATFGSLGSLLEEALYNVYFHKGWKSTDKGQSNDNRRMPTLGDFYFEVAKVIDRRFPIKNDADTQKLKSIVLGRLSSLLRGGKGYMLNVQRSVDIAKLMGKPTILELESINHEDKALIMLFLLTALREYRMAHPVYNDIAHVTLIEEAHNVMLRPSGVINREISSDAGPAAARLFSQALSELREIGQGIVVIDQIPGRLIEDALKNTNTKIIHRLPGRDDAIEIGSTMSLDSDQIEFLARLQTGQAMFFTTNMQKATVISVKSGRSVATETRVSDAQLEQHMASNKESAIDELPFSGCRFCPRPCFYRERIAPVAYQASTNSKVAESLTKFKLQSEQSGVEVGWQVLIEFCSKGASEAGFRANPEASYCYLNHVYQIEITKEVAQRFVPISN